MDERKKTEIVISEKMKIKLQLESAKHENEGLRLEIQSFHEMKLELEKLRKLPLKTTARDCIIGCPIEDYIKLKEDCIELKEKLEFTKRNLAIESSFTDYFSNETDRLTAQLQKKDTSAEQDTGKPRQSINISRTELIKMVARLRGVVYCFLDINPSETHKETLSEARIILDETSFDIDGSLQFELGFRKKKGD